MTDVPCKIKVAKWAVFPFKIIPGKCYSQPAVFLGNQDSYIVKAGKSRPEIIWSCGKKITGLAFGAFFLKQENLFKMSAAACKKEHSFSRTQPSSYFLI